MEQPLHGTVTAKDVPTDLYNAVQRLDEKRVITLLDKNTNQYQANEQGDLPIHALVTHSTLSTQQLRILESLLDHDKNNNYAIVYKKNRFGTSAYDLIFGSLDIQAMAVVLKRTHDPNKLISNTGTPLHKAVATNNVAAATFLLDNKADKTAKNSRGDSVETELNRLLWTIPSILGNDPTTYGQETQDYTQMKKLSFPDEETLPTPSTANQSQQEVVTFIPTPLCQPQPSRLVYLSKKVAIVSLCALCIALALWTTHRRIRCRTH
jgi:hypothetical protein